MRASNSVVVCAAVAVVGAGACFDLLGGRRQEAQPSHAACGDECRSDYDCRRGNVCFQWTCHPGCLSDSECGPGRVCEGYICHDVLRHADAGLAPDHAERDAGMVYRRDAGPPRDAGAGSAAPPAVDAGTEPANDAEADSSSADAGAS